MKITVLQENLKHGLSIVSRATSPRATLPVLGNILIATENGRLRLAATDLELSITGWIGASIEQEGATTVPARTFFDLVGTLPPDAISLDYDDATSTMKLSCDKSKTQLKCIHAEEFPPIALRASGTPTFENDGFEIETKCLLEMIRQTAFSASRDIARPVLTGVLITIAEDRITLASADGFRLSEHKARLSSPVAEPVSALVPAKSLNELAHILKNKDGLVTIAFANGRVAFRTPDIELATQLIEGEFPDYHQIIPEEHTTRMVVPTDALRKACQQAGVFARNDSLVATLDIREEIVEVSAQADELGSSRTQVAVVTEGPGMHIAFNTHYLQDALAVIQTPSVALEISDPVKPGTIRPVGEEGNFLHVLMPMNTVS